VNGEVAGSAGADAREHVAARTHQHPPPTRKAIADESDVGPGWPRRRHEDDTAVGESVRRGAPADRNERETGRQDGRTAPPATAASRPVCSTPWEFH
jgi:hypothetical protein